MRDEENRKKRKSERIFSNGVIILVFLLLAVQSVFFFRQLINNHLRSRIPAETSVTHSASPDGRTESKPDSSSSSSSGTQAAVQSSGGPKAGISACAGTSAEKPDNAMFPDSQEKKESPDYEYDGWKWDMVELNSADSAALDALPGIGPYYARQILAYRERLGFYADISQLLDIRGMDTARLNRLSGRLYIAPESLRPLDLYTLPVDSMAAHPYIGPYAAKGIDRLRRTLPEAEFNFQAILDSKILPEAQARRLALYFPETEEP